MPRQKAPILNPVAAWVVIGAVTVAGLIAAQPVFADEEHEASCTVATLRGLYIFDATGYVISATGHAPKAVVEFLRINGDGTLTSVATANVNGNVIAHDSHGTGGYTVNQDCTGTLAFNPAGPHFDIFIAPGGKEFHMIQTDASNVLAGVSLLDSESSRVFKCHGPHDRVTGAWSRAAHPVGCRADGP